jgi:hypothetical protein
VDVTSVDELLATARVVRKRVPIPVQLNDFESASRPAPETITFWNNWGER